MSVGGSGVGNREQRTGIDLGRIRTGLDVAEALITIVGNPQLIAEMRKQTEALEAAATRAKVGEDLEATKRAAALDRQAALDELAAAREAAQTTRANADAVLAEINRQKSAHDAEIATHAAAHAQRKRDLDTLEEATKKVAAQATLDRQAAAKEREAAEAAHREADQRLARVKEQLAKALGG